MIPKTLKQILRSSPMHSRETVYGWVTTTRQHKDNTFILVNDGSCIQDLQIVAKGIKIPVGTSVKITGELIPSRGSQNVEILASDVTVLGECDPSSYPLFKSRATFEHLREFPHLRSRSRTFAAMNRIRNSAILGIQDYFQNNDFIQVHTPILTSNDCEGGGEAFELKSKFFSKPAYLTVSAQLHLEMMSAAHARVYTLNPCFRAEPSNSTRHLAEFWMLEAEIAFIDELPQLLDFIENQLIHTTTFLREKCSQELEFCQAFIDKSVSERLEMMTRPFARMTYTKAIEILYNSKKNWTYPVKWGLGLQSEHERYLAEEYCKKPVFITNYPSKVKPFYMKSSKDGETVECTDLLIPKIGELVGGSLRSDDCKVLKRQISEAGLDAELYEWYVDLRRFGTVPHGGYGLGLERYLAFITGMSNIQRSYKVLAQMETTIDAALQKLSLDNVSSVLKRKANEYYRRATNNPTLKSISHTVIMYACIYMSCKENNQTIQHILCAKLSGLSILKFNQQLTLLKKSLKIPLEIVSFKELAIKHGSLKTISHLEEIKHSFIQKYSESLSRAQIKQTDFNSNAITAAIFKLCCQKLKLKLSKNFTDSIESLNEREFKSYLSLVAEHCSQELSLLEKDLILNQNKNKRKRVDSEPENTPKITVTNSAEPEIQIVKKKTLSKLKHRSVSGFCCMIGTSDYQKSKEYRDYLTWKELILSRKQIQNEL